MEIIEKENNIRIINDTYNASFDSMKAGMENLARMKGNRKIAVLGDILELGNFAEEIHKKVGEEVYKNNINILITVGKNAKYISETAINLGMDKKDVYICNTNEEAINKLHKIMKEGDCILVKASNGMKFKEIVDNL